MNPLNLPSFVIITFLSTIVFIILYVFWMLRNIFLKENNPLFTKIIIGIFLWLILQTSLVLNNIYNTNLNVLPPRILLFGVLPTILLMFYVLFSKAGQKFLDKFHTENTLQHLTLLHIIRIPVEMVLYWLACVKVVPFLMTFEGRNFDIFAGITAPFVIYAVFFFNKTKINYKLLLFWNILAMLLLANIIFHAIFSAPAPFQIFAFDQPNIAILYFPVSLLPTFIVPMVIFSHLIVVRKCIKEL